MIVEASLALTAGYLLNAVALFVHTKINKKITVQSGNGIRFTYVEPIEDTDEEISTMTVKELKAYAKSLGLRGYSKLNKSVLQSFIVEYLQNV